MRHAFIVDPLASLSVGQDTTIAFMREAQRRGHEIHTCGVGSVAVPPGGRPAARLAPTRMLGLLEQLLPTISGQDLGAAVKSSLDPGEATFLALYPSVRGRRVPDERSLLDVADAAEAVAVEPPTAGPTPERLISGPVPLGTVVAPREEAILGTFSVTLSNGVST